MNVRGLLLVMCVGLFGCPKKPVYPNCEGDKDCENHERCVNQQCMQCAEDADCEPGKSCREGACMPIEGWCAADGDCEMGQVCKNNRCASCKADDDCGEGGRCHAGKCVRRGQCLRDDDCDDDEDCVRGVCSKTGLSSPTGKESTPSCTLSTIYFDYDQAAIASDAKPLLQKNSECLSSTPRGVAVIGYTDPRGTDEYNVALSDQRARAVADYLARLGIDPARLRVVPKGEADATGTEEESWRHDRRVEFTWE